MREKRWVFRAKARLASFIKWAGNDGNDQY